VGAAAASVDGAPAVAVRDCDEAAAVGSAAVLLDGVPAAAACDCVEDAAVASAVTAPADDAVAPAADE